MKLLVNSLGILALAIVLAGCASQSGNVQPNDNTGGANAQSETSGAGQNANGETQNLGEVRPDQNVVHFAFNKSAIQPEYTRLLKHTAAYLVAHSDQNVRVEGYTDERGTKAYNMALGARRAQAVKRYLMLQGVSPDQLNTVSYGEENPADPAHNEAAWAKNRRAVIAYQ